MPETETEPTRTLFDHLYEAHRKQGRKVIEVNERGEVTNMTAEEYDAEHAEFTENPKEDE